MSIVNPSIMNNADGSPIEYLSFSELVTRFEPQLTLFNQQTLREIVSTVFNRPNHYNTSYRQNLIKKPKYWKNEENNSNNKF